MAKACFDCRLAEDEALVVVCATELAQLYTTVAADKVHSLCRLELSCHVQLSRHVLCMHKRPDFAELSDTAAKHGCMNRHEVADRMWQ